MYLHTVQTRGPGHLQTPKLQTQQQLFHQHATQKSIITGVGTEPSVRFVMVSRGFPRLCRNADHEFHRMQPIHHNQPMLYNDLCLTAFTCQITRRLPHLVLRLPEIGGMCAKSNDCRPVHMKQWTEAKTMWLM